MEEEIEVKGISANILEVDSCEPMNNTSSTTSKKQVQVQVQQHENPRNNNNNNKNKKASDSIISSVTAPPPPSASSSSSSSSVIASSGVGAGAGVGSGNDKTPSMHFPTKIIGIGTFLLLMMSHIILLHQCSTAILQRQQQQQSDQQPNNNSNKNNNNSNNNNNKNGPLLRKFRTMTKTTSIRLNIGPYESGRMIAKLDPGEIVEIYDYDQIKSRSTNSKWVHIYHPKNGFAHRHFKSGKDSFQEIAPNNALDNDSSSSSKNGTKITTSTKTTTATSAAATRDAYMETSCPLLYLGWDDSRKPNNRYLFAPFSLVVAQQLWNAAQIGHLFLLVLLTASIVTNAPPPTTSSSTTSTTTPTISIKILLRSLAFCSWILTIGLLPFSTYVSAPGAHYFALLVLCTSGVAATFGQSFEATIESSHQTINTTTSSSSTMTGTHATTTDNVSSCEVNEDSSVALIESGSSTTLKHRNDTGDHDNTIPTTTDLETNNNNNNNSSGTNTQSIKLSSIFLCRVETIAFLCNLFCTIYNYNAARSVWPYWNDIFRHIDSIFHWVGDNASSHSSASRMDCTIEQFYKFFMTSVRIPLFVPRMAGSTTGSIIFLGIWSILPFLYVSYFLCMYALTVRSPSYQNIQRILSLVGLFHFLFLTDVISYKFGRGYWTPHAELVHWLERFVWRIAILLPIYQNVTSRHWIHSSYDESQQQQQQQSQSQQQSSSSSSSSSQQPHQNRNRNRILQLLQQLLPIINKIIHDVTRFWGEVFFVYQFICSDIIRFCQFLLGWKNEISLIEYIFGDRPVQIFSYHVTLSFMTILYGGLLLKGIVENGGYKIILQKKKKKKKNTTTTTTTKTTKRRGGGERR